METNQPQNISPEDEIQTRDIQVPVFLTGRIEKEEISFCMDGAKYRIITMLGENRVKAMNNETEKFLDGAAGRRLRVTIGGYPTWGPECGYISAYYADTASGTMKKLNMTFERH